MNELESIIYQYLSVNCQGKNQAIKLKELGKKISIESIPWREIAKAIENLRLSGRPIATAACGAFIPVTNDEKKACLRTIYRRALNTLKTVKALEKAFGKQIIEEVSTELNLLSNGQFEMKLCEVR